MKPSDQSQTVQPLASGPSGQPAHRSGAVARMLRMPVATLRVWERRYGLTHAALSAGGQRLYSADDVRRLALLKQLTDLGHAIGSLATLDLSQLQRVASTHEQALAVTRKGTSEAADRRASVRPWRLVVIGAALGARLQRPALLRSLDRPLVLLGPFDDAAQAAAAPGASDADAVLLHEPHLQADWLASIDAAAPALAGLPKAVLYGFAAERVCDALATNGTFLLREPQPDAVLAQWLRALSTATTATIRPAPDADADLSSAEPVPPRRWDDTALADFASRATTISCECPRHVAELLMQLSHFEAYSADCAHRDVADAELHAYLRQVAAASRARFEAALEHVALHEGLMLPAWPRQDARHLPTRERRQKRSTSTPQRDRP